LLGIEPRLAGHVAALHAISDIYASGGTPRWGLSILAVDPDHPEGTAESILGGMFAACRDEAVAVVGGHTLVSREALAGLTVIGVPASSRVIRKTGARVGSGVFLSKPLGVGLVCRAHALRVCGGDTLDEAVATMLVSNRLASIAMVGARVEAATDVSGFGLLGHLSEMLSRGLGARLALDDVPVLGGARQVADGAFHAPALRGNLAYVRRRCRLETRRELEALAPLLDPQTNGGLLVVGDEAAADVLLRNGVFRRIGEITDSGRIEVL
jgi:selenide,water dikinase